ncbi:MULTISPECIES: hypothetical protein [unclassified Haloarcula]|uniref:hypothetical protein n=1 Tax=unclassified Haloarcula TaxID=2624677 RepID=UPI000EF19BB4|nr:MULTISPECIES: hypothetical protein [unclassified Haloarcula]RLM37272.1 hypothetical protein DVK01_11790 [Haloarcula sp. Atlit-120R]RLM44338.1 hypothetical protein DVK00_07670 [Haloarcula sp. Atlit-47R]
MERASDRTGETRSPAERTPSFGHLLLVWLLVGPSLWSLGSAVADAIQAELPLSTMGAGLLFGTIVVVSFWTAGFQPSLRASFGYFVAELSIYLVLAVGVVTVFVPTFTPWVTIAVQLVSICLAATLVFTPVGANIRNWFRRHVRSLLKLPPQDRSVDRD